MRDADDLEFVVFFARLAMQHAHVEQKTLQPGFHYFLSSKRPEFLIQRLKACLHKYRLQYNNYAESS